jgi:hypothetical protein
MGKSMPLVSYGMETGGCPFKEIKMIPASKSIRMFTIVPKGAEKWEPNGRVFQRCPHDVEHAGNVMPK